MNTLKVASKILAPYARQRNSGNGYEIWCILTLLRKAGLTNTDLDVLAPELAAIQAAGNKQTLEQVSRIRSIPLTPGLIFDGHPIVDMENATQDDTVGTGDLILVTDGGQRLSISITEGAAAKLATLKKCISNTGAGRMGCSPAEIDRMKEVEKAMGAAYKAEMTARFGPNEAAWPARTKTAAAIDPCKDVANRYCEQFAAFSDEQKRTIMNDVHWISRKPADYYAFVHKTKGTIKFFRVNPSSCINPATWTPRVKANGVFIETYNGDTLVSKTQVKPNYGAGTSIRKWNLVMNLTDNFGLTPCSL
jgi:hypothetical protein